VELKFGRSEFEKRHYALFGLMCVYGIELLDDNVVECQQNMLELFADYTRIDEFDDLFRAANYVLSQNIVHGDARTMLTSTGEPITFAEWGYLGKAKFQRRDFRFDMLTQMSSFGEDTLFSGHGKHEIFIPTKSYPPLTAKDLAGG
jgi:hypothetical protein